MLGNKQPIVVSGFEYLKKKRKKNQIYLKYFAKSVTNGNYAEIASRGTDFSSLIYVLSDGIAELVLKFFWCKEKTNIQIRYVGDS